MLTGRNAGNRRALTTEITVVAITITIVLIRSVFKFMNGFAILIKMGKPNQLKQ